MIRDIHYTIQYIIQSKRNNIIDDDDDDDDEASISKRTFYAVGYCWKRDWYELGIFFLKFHKAIKIGLTDQNGLLTNGRVDNCPTNFRTLDEASVVDPGSEKLSLYKGLPNGWYW